MSTEELSDGNKREHLQAILAVGKFVLENGPVVKTQEAGRLYLEQKGLTRRKLSIEYYELFSRFLNLVQVYMFGRAFLIQNSSNVQNVVKCLSDTIDEEAVIKKIVEERLKDSFKLQLQYLDSHRDRQVLKALVAELTNTSFAANLQGLQSRKGTRNAKKSVQSNLKLYADIRATSQTIRSDLTTSQQHKLTERMISARKLKEIKTIAEGRGRKLKSREFPELAAILAYAFGECDGGLEAHPRLTTGTLYRASDSATTMKRARDIMLAYAPDGFKISISSCYNYTENYRKGSRQAKQHHFGQQGVNAQISLKKPPRTGVQQFVVNLHWSTANVNLIVDSRHNQSNSLVVSKDAKAIVPADIAPVQRPGHSWKSRMILPDHTWDQSRTNAVTPMTFLFLITSVKQLPATSVECLETQISNTTTLHLTRTGQGVTLLNLSFYEPETTFRCLNEIFHLLMIPALDPFFPDHLTGKLKKEFTFVVDNGPAEQPSSAIVQMCLVRLMNFLKLDKITQVSFSEYHSKRNFVERVHAEENRVLSSHGPFSSTSVHPVADAGTQQHVANMESMAEEVRKCLMQGSFGGRQLMAFRGVKEEQHIFNDQEKLESFLSLSEEGKQHFTPSTYSVKSGEVLRCLHLYWDTDEDFQGQYLTDHKTLHNEVVDGTRTAWTDKYTTSLYSTKVGATCQRYELQPIPDYLRWLKTCELHYLPLEERVLTVGPWDDIPGAFLPSKVLDLCLSIIPEPTDSLIQQFSLLSWTTPSEVRQYIKKVQDKIEGQIESEKERERWKSNTLYKTKTKPQLEVLCRNLKIPVTPALAKHQLTRLILEKQGEPLPPPTPCTLHNGDLTTVPTTSTAINRMTIANLRSILKHHNLPIVGTKEQLVMRVFLLRHNQTSAVIAREEGQIKDLISLAYECIYQQRRLHLTSHIYRKRTYSLRPSNPEFVVVPSSIRSESDLNKCLFQPILSYIEDCRRHREEKDKSLVFRPVACKQTSEDLTERIVQIGSKVKVKWLSEEVKESGWRAGWYTATVHNYSRESDIITITYTTEPGVTYEEELTPLIANNKIKLISSPL